MIYYNNETDEAVRRHYELNDQQYQFYLNNRQWILEKIRHDQLNLRESQDLKEKVQNLEQEAKLSNKRNSADVLEYNVVLQYMDGGVEPRKAAQIAKMAGCTKPLIRHYRDTAYRDLRVHFESEEEIYEQEEFADGIQVLSQVNEVQWLN